MGVLQVLFYLIGALYLIAVFIELPMFYGGNPKVDFFMKKIGKKNLKILYAVIGFILIAIARFAF